MLGQRQRSCPRKVRRRRRRWAPRSWRSPRGRKDYTVRTGVLEDHPYRVVAVQAGPGQALVIAQRLDPTEQVFTKLGISLPIVGGVGVILAAIAGVAVARAALRPVDRLTDATERVAATGDMRPIAVDGNDELARLTYQLQRDARRARGVARAATPARRRRRPRAAHPAHVHAHEPGAARRCEPTGRTERCPRPTAPRSSRTSRRRSRSCPTSSGTSWSWPATTRRPSSTSRSSSPT